jgi:4-hydroxy-tetrahydrodipicolinate reductase
MNTQKTLIRVGLFGFGRTGAVVAAEMVDSPRCTLSWVVRKSTSRMGEYVSRLHGVDSDEGMIHWIGNVNDEFFVNNPVDVIVDFSTSETVHLYRSAAQQGTRILSAISNYNREDLTELKKLSHKTAVLYSPNISIGVNLLLLTAMVVSNVIPQADVAILEEHFSEKPDVSGTALRIAKKLKLDPATCVKSIRAGGIVGKHEVLFGLPNQTLRICHESITRSAFGRGALTGAEWLMECPKGFYTMEQLVASRFRDALSELR